MMRVLLLAASITITAAVTSKLTSILGSGPSSRSYEDFRRLHGHRQGADSVSYATRQTLYHSRIADIAAHNAQRRSWVAGVNKFADYTDEEFQRLLGYKRRARSSRGPTSPSSFLQLEPAELVAATPLQLAREVDWRPKLTSSRFVRDQGNCGSCWAVATVGALEMQSEMKCGNTTQLSVQQLVDCVPNPQHCGGTGGCEGATAELAFEYVQQQGLHGDSAYSAPGLFRTGSSCSTGKPLLSLTGWQRLPVNEGNPLLMAIANKGPAVVSVDGTNWMPYQSGVFDNCEKDATVNHAVLAIGYGIEKSSEKGEQLYWLIRNSWGGGWGEQGHIRIMRHTGDKDHCGVDRDPKQGVGCDGGPEEIPVCGMCGILSDSSHPVGALVHG